MKIKLSFWLSVAIFIAVFTSCTSDGYPKSVKDVDVSNASSVFDDIDIETVERENAYCELRQNGKLIGYELLYVFMDEDNYLDELILPSEYNGYPIISYGGSGYTQINKIIVPDSYRYLWDYSFNNCWNLKEIILPETILHYGDGLFESCGSLQSIDLPSTMTRIPAYMFNYCNSLNNVVLPDGITEIGFGAFRWCRSLDNIHIPDSVTRIEYESFLGCHFENLDFLPDTVEYISSNAFTQTPNYMDYTIKEIRFPKNLKKVEHYFFQNVQSLEKLEIHSGIQEIGRNSFEDCKNLSEVAIRLDENNSLSLKKVYLRAFKGCSSLNEVKIIYNPELVEDFDEFKESIENALCDAINVNAEEEKIGLEGLPLNFVSSELYDQKVDVEE